MIRTQRNTTPCKCDLKYVGYRDVLEFLCNPDALSQYGQAQLLCRVVRNRQGVKALDAP